MKACLKKYGTLNCPLPKLSLLMVRTWPPSAFLSTCTRQPPHLTTTRWPAASKAPKSAQRTLELAGACPLATDGADVRAITAAQHWNTMVAVFGFDKVASAVKRVSIREGELSIDQPWRIIASSAPRK